MQCRFLTCCLLSSALVFCGVCTSIDSADAETVPQKLERLEKDINSLQRKVYRGEVIIPQNLPPSVAKDSGVQKSDVDKAFASLPMIEQQLAAVTDKNEVLSHRMDTLEKKLEKLSADIEIRFAALEKSEHERRIREEEDAARAAKAEALEKEKARLLAAIKAREEANQKAKEEEERLKKQKTPVVVPKPNLSESVKPAETAPAANKDDNPSKSAEAVKNDVKAVLKAVESKQPAESAKPEKPADISAKPAAVEKQTGESVKDKPIQEKEVSKEKIPAVSENAKVTQSAKESENKKAETPVSLIKSVTKPPAASDTAEKTVAAPVSLQPAKEDKVKSAESSVAVAPVPASNSNGHGGKEEKSYKRAYDLVTSGNYAEAEAAFVAFINEYFNSDLMPNALYWLGETYYARKDFEMAAMTFRNCYHNYPKSSKAEDSLLKLGLSHKSLRNNKEACYVFKNFARIYPNASADLKSRAAKEAEIIRCK